MAIAIWYQLTALPASRWLVAPRQISAINGEPAVISGTSQPVRGSIFKVSDVLSAYELCFSDLIQWLIRLEIKKIANVGTKGSKEPSLKW